MKTLRRVVPLVLLPLAVACGQDFALDSADAGSQSSSSSGEPLRDSGSSAPRRDAGNGAPAASGRLDARVDDASAVVAISRDSGDQDATAHESADTGVAVDSATRAEASAVDSAKDGDVGDSAKTGEVGDSGNDASACRQPMVVLSSASTFAVLAGSTVTSVGATSVTGSLGVSPGTAVTGFPPATLTSGSMHDGDPVAAQAEADLTTAYDEAASRTRCAESVAGELGSRTLAPGLYKSAAAITISTGNLTLDGRGNADAVFVFQTSTALNVSAGIQVVLIGGARSTNVFWQVGSAATLGGASSFVGTIMASQAITMDTGAALNGRALAISAAVTLLDNGIAVPAP